MKQVSKILEEDNLLNDFMNETGNWSVEQVNELEKRIGTYSCFNLDDTVMGREWWEGVEEYEALATKPVIKDLSIYKRNLKSKPING